MRSPAVDQRGAGVARLAVGQQLRVAGGQVVAKKLVELAAPLVLAKDEIVALVRMIRGRRDAIGEKRNLSAIGPRRGDVVYLVGVGKARARSAFRGAWGANPEIAAERNSV